MQVGKGGGAILGSRREPGGWSVGTHLAVIVVAVVIVFVVVGAALGRDTWRNAKRDVREDAGSLAAVAADKVAETVDIIRAQLDAVAANPAVPQLLAAPAECPLEFTLDVFPGAHLDLLRIDGTVGCSSAPGDVGDLRDAPWLEQLAEVSGRFESGPFPDTITGQLTVVYATPVDGADGRRLGGIAIVVPTAAMAEELADAFGHRGLFSLAVIDESSGTVLSAGAGLPDRGDPMRTAGFISAARPVAGTSWSAQAGADPARALAPARSVLLRGALLGAIVLVVLLGALTIVNRRIAEPLRRLTRVVGDSGPHTAAALGQVRGPSEIVRLGERFQASVEERQRFEEQLASQALHDPVTGIANRALLAERLTLSLEHAARTDAAVGVLFIDLDRFKLINESLGHAVGDVVLARAADRLRPLVRAGDTLARFGADEFVLVRDGCEDLSDLDVLADRVLESLNELQEAGDTIVRLTASIGIAASTPEDRDTDLIRDAHAAMYLAKERGRARREWFDPGLHARASTRLTMETELQAAMERDQLHLVYQPKIDLHTSAVVGVEALLRWDHPALGSVPPDVFIPVAEESGLMGSIGVFVLRRACEQAAVWERDGTGVPVAVNISGRQFDDADLAGQIESVLDSVGLPPSRLCLEITETLLMSDTVRSTQLMRDIHALGVQLSIDDFGTGYSSLAYLHRYAFDELKIDRAFIDGMMELAGQRTLVEAMVAMGKALGLAVVAEGVETEDQASALRDLGCDVAQGYLYARPQPADSLRLPVHDS